MAIRLQPNSIHGELVLLYSFIWLLLAAWGPGPYSLDAWIRKGRSAA